MAEAEAPVVRERPATAPRANGSTERLLTRRRTLPGSRAVVGGFLIAVAALGIFVAYTSATARPHQLYVVTTRAIPAGSRLTEADLRLAAIDLPDPTVRAQLFSSTRVLIGAGVLAPIGPGGLVEASMVVGRGGSIGSREISIAIDRSRAVGGTLKAGEYVDLLGTFGNGAEAYTTVMVPHVLVLTIVNVNSSIGDTRTQLITLAAASELDAEAIADASVAAQVTLVRSAETGGGPPPPATPAYRAPTGPTSSRAGGGNATSGATPGGATGSTTGGATPGGG